MHELTKGQRLRQQQGGSTAWGFIRKTLGVGAAFCLHMGISQGVLGGGRPSLPPCTNPSSRYLLATWRCLTVCRCAPQPHRPSALSRNHHSERGSSKIGMPSRWHHERVPKLSQF